MNDFVCRMCGETIDWSFATRFRCCPVTTGCGSTHIRKKNQFDNLKSWHLAELLYDMQTRLETLEDEIVMLKKGENP